MIKTLHVIKSFVVLIIFCVLFSTAFAGQKIYVSGGYAIKGMDTVAYFTKNKEEVLKNFLMNGKRLFGYLKIRNTWIYL